MFDSRPRVIAVRGQRCSASVLAQHGMRGVSRGALAGVDGDGISVGDVLAQVVAAEGGACAVAQAAGGDPVVLGVDRDDPPAVAVAHWIVGRNVLSLSEDRDRRIILAADDQIPDRDVMPPRRGDCRCVRVDGFVVQAAVDRICDSSTSWYRSTPMP